MNNNFLALEIYHLIEEFFTNIENLEEEKVDQIKDYYYSWLKDKLGNLEREDMLIGMNKNRNYLFLKSKNLENPVYIINRKSNKYFIKTSKEKENTYLTTQEVEKQNSPQITEEEINIKLINKKRKIEENTIKKKCKANCNII